MPSLFNLLKPRPDILGGIKMANFKKYTKKNGQEAWQFSAYLGTDPKTGKRIKTTRRGFETKKQAQRACNQLLAEFDADDWTTMQSHGNTQPSTFKEIAELWLTSYKLTVQDPTYVGTVNALKYHIYPFLGDKPIKEITRLDCQQAVNEWYLRYSDVGSLISKVKRVFKYAITLGIVDSNPVDAVLKPKPKDVDKRVKVYSKQEMRVLMTYLKNKQTKYNDHQNYALFRLLFYSGLRIGEALALNWSDIDFKNKTLNIDKTTKIVNKTLVVGQPKTKSSIAVLPLDEETLNILKYWQLYQKQARLAIGLVDNVPVFSRLDGGYNYNAVIYNRLKAIAKAAQLPFYGVHVTRHTHASLLIEAGANLKEVQKRLRHSSITMTMDVYGHLSKEYEASTLDKFISFVGSQNGSQGLG